MPRASCPRAQLWGKIRLNYILHTVVIFINLVPHKHTLAGQLEPKNHIEERNFSKKNPNQITLATFLCHGPQTKSLPK